MNGTPSATTSPVALSHLQGLSSSSTRSSTSSSPTQPIAIGPTILTARSSDPFSPTQPTRVATEQKNYKILKAQPFSVIQNDGDKNCEYKLTCPIIVKQNIFYVKGVLAVHTKEAIPSKEEAVKDILNSLRVCKRPYGKVKDGEEPQFIACRMDEIFKRGQRAPYEVEITDDITPLQKMKGYRIPYTMKFSFAAHTVSKTHQAFWTIFLNDQPLLKDILIKSTSQERDDTINVIRPSDKERAKELDRGLDEGEATACWASIYQEAYTKGTPVATPVRRKKTDQETSSRAKRKSSLISNSPSKEKEFDSSPDSSPVAKRSHHQPSPSGHAVSASSSQTQHSSATSSELHDLQTARDQVLQIQELTSQILGSLQTDQQALQKKEQENATLREKLKEANKRADTAEKRVTQLEKDLKQMQDKIETAKKLFGL